MGPRRMFRAHRPQKKVSGLAPEPTSDQTALTQIHYSTGVVRLLEKPKIGTKILPGATQGFDTKTSEAYYF